MDKITLFSLILFLISLLATLVSSDAQFNTICEQEHIIYRTTGLKNAHVAVAEDTSDGYFDVCSISDSGHECIDFNSDSLNDNVVFRIGSERTKNAHVEANYLETTGYEDLCFGSVECTYKTECEEQEECFGSIFREENSHVGDCNAYDTKICCTPGCRVLDAFWSKNGVNQITTANEEEVVFMVVKGTSACSNIGNVNLKVYKSALEQVLSVNAQFEESGRMLYAWETKRHCSTCVTDPNFYFEVNYLGNKLRSKTPDLTVLEENSVETECGDGRITGNEICDIGLKSDNSDDIFVRNLKCEDGGWTGSLTCNSCTKINTSSCQGASGSCGDNTLNPGEICDGNKFLKDLDSCSDLKSDLSGNLECRNCQYNSSQCKVPDISSSRCNSCSQCDNLFSDSCTQNVCVNACGGPGSCYYALGSGEDCKSCQLVTTCEDYTNELDCEIDRCILLLDKPCEWDNGICKENDKCTWNCNSIYSECINGERSKTGTCSLVSGNCNAILDNPALNYPDSSVCIELEEDFPVFSLFNIIISLSLITSFYLIIKIKKRG